MIGSRLPVFLVELDELLDVGDHFGIGEFLADLFVFEPSDRPVW